MKKTAILIIVTVLLLAVSTYAQNKVVVIPLNSNSNTGKLWGQGRVGATLFTHTPASGYCSSPAGIKSALSTHMEAWGCAQSVCPSGTWVCREGDLPATGSCPANSVSTFEHRDCYGTKFPSINQTPLTSFYGWLADAASSIDYPGFGKTKLTGNFTTESNAPMCQLRHVWCCWQ